MIVHESPVCINKIVMEYSQVNKRIGVKTDWEANGKGKISDKRRIYEKEEQVF